MKKEMSYNYRIEHWRTSSHFSVTKKRTLERLRDGEGIRMPSQNHWQRPITMSRKILTTSTKYTSHFKSSKTTINMIRMSSIIRKSNMSNRSQTGTHKSAWTDQCHHRAYRTRAIAIREVSRSPVQSMKFGAFLINLKVETIAAIVIIGQRSYRKSMRIRLDCRGKLIYIIDENFPLYYLLYWFFYYFVIFLIYSLLIDLFLH